MILKIYIRGRLRIFRSFKDYLAALLKPGCCVYQPITLTLLGNGVDPICDGTDIDFTVYTEMDLSPYGVDANTPITSNQDIIDAFADLGITVSIGDCPDIVITAGYYGEETTVQLLPLLPMLAMVGYVEPVCVDGDIDFVNYNAIDLTPFGGGIEAVASEQDIIDAFDAEGLTILIIDCVVYITAGDDRGQTELQFSLTS